jgi:hypothetical protein
MDLGKTLELNGIRPVLTTVYYFENLEHGKKDNPHYHISIPTFDGGFLLLVMFTSKIENKKEHYGLVNQNALSSLVFANKNDFIFLSKDSVIDCNQPIYKTKEELGAIIKNLEYKEANLTQEFIEEIKEAVQSSPIVRRNIKKALK